MSDTMATVVVDGVYIPLDFSIVPITFLNTGGRLQLRQNSF